MSSGRSCPRLTFKRTVITDGAFAGIHVAARDDSKQVGEISTRLWDTKTPYVAWIEVEPDRCRQGIATRLYEQAAAATCEVMGSPLASDTERTEASQAFWAKQVARGRATCVEPGEPSGGPAINNPTMPATGRGGCLYYQLKSCGERVLGRSKHSRRRRRVR